MSEYLDYTGLQRVVTKTKQLIANKQDTLVSGNNIKTINNQSLLGSGNISISGTQPTTVKIDGNSITSNNEADIKTMNGNYNATTNKMATQSDLPDITTKANTDASNIDASTWKTALSLENVENYKIVTGRVLCYNHPTEITAGLTTLVGFCAMIELDSTNVITSYYPLLHRIAGGKAYVSLRQTSNGAVNTSGAVYVRYIAFGT